VPKPTSAEAAPDDQPVIRSLTNSTIKYVRSLQRRRTRWQERAFVVEGPRGVADAFAAGANPTLLVVREGTTFDLPENPDRSRRAPRRLVVAGPLFDVLADTVSPQGVLAVFPFPDVPATPASAPLHLVLDRLRDPGNVGTLLRTAAGAGVTAVHLSPESVDPFNPKTVRAAMGAHFRLPIRPLADEDIDNLRETCPLRVVADAAGSLPYDALDWTQPAVLILGSEAHGASNTTRHFATQTVGIPLASGVESLNAAVAGAVILFEAARQRRRGHQGGARAPAAS